MHVDIVFLINMNRYESEDWIICGTLKTWGGGPAWHTFSSFWINVRPHLDTCDVI